jgi:hypothetical protein
MPPEKRSARIFRRPHAPLAKPTPEFPNVPFDFINDFVMIDRLWLQPAGGFLLAASS